MNLVKLVSKKFYFLVVVFSVLSCGFAQSVPWIGESEDISILCNGVVGYNQFLLQSVDVASEFDINSEILSQLNDFKKRLAQENIELLLVILPPRGITTNLSTTSYSHIEARENFDSFIEHIQVSGIDTLNLLEGISDEDRQNFYRFQDPHWSVTGLKLTSEKVAEYIESKNVFFEAEEIESSLEAVDSMPYYLELVLEGCPDLAKNYTDSYSLGNGVETIQVKNAVVASDENLQSSLLGDEISSIVVAGTSQSNSPYRFDSWLSSEISTPVINYSVGGGSAYSSLELLLSDLQQENIAKPQLIIWEMPVSEMTKITTDNQGPAFDNPQSMSQISPWLYDCNQVIGKFEGQGIGTLTNKRQPLSNLVQEVSPKGATVSEDASSGNTIMTFTGESDPWLSYIVPKSRLPKESKLNFEVSLLTKDSSVTHTELFVHTSTYSDILAQSGLLLLEGPEKELGIGFEIPYEIQDSLIVFRIDGPDEAVKGTTMEVIDVSISGVSSLEEETLFSDLKHHNIYGDRYFLELEAFDEIDNNFVVEFNYGSGITSSLPVSRSSRVFNNNVYRVALSPFISRSLESIEILFNQDVNSLGIKNAMICSE